MYTYAQRLSGNVWVEQTTRQLRNFLKHLPGDFDTIDKILDYTVRYDLKIYKKRKNCFQVGKHVSRFSMKPKPKQRPGPINIFYSYANTHNIVFVDILQLEHFRELVSVWCHASDREQQQQFFQGRPSCFFYFILGICI